MRLPKIGLPAPLWVCQAGSEKALSHFAALPNGQLRLPAVLHAPESPHLPPWTDWFCPPDGNNGV